MIQPAVMAPPLNWLISDAAADTKVIRLLAEIRATHSQVVGADWVTGAAVRPCRAAANGSFG